MSSKNWNFDWNISDFGRSVQNFYPHVWDFVDFDWNVWYFYQNSNDYVRIDEISTDMFDTITEMWDFDQNLQYFD